ncbi:MAG: winged helix-turn-helix domain-containing protein [Patescibacteria group bacterium]|jgi:DNA-binding transcriptional ArsR family regulator
MPDIFRENNRELMRVFQKNRLLILKSLFQCGEDVCGCTLLETLSVPKNLLSYHIRYLRGIGFIEEVKCGKSKQYRIATNSLEKVRVILKAVDLL